MKAGHKQIFGIDIDLENVKSPYDLYRKMRPYYFSDSYTRKVMDKEMFRLVMSKLSTDNKQDLFEDFTRQVAERLITPNLIPQTGPTGGGDGGTDIETYPVSREISDRWYVPHGGCNGEDKWAFAISCKTSISQKIKSDIAKIASLPKPFKRIYFCTNQDVSSRNKKKYEDDLKAQYGVEVVVLDYKWYEQAVFDQGCYNIAIDTLNLSNSLREEVIEGPLDKQRKAELQELEELVNSKGYIQHLDTEYVNDLLRIAVLTRELERPSVEVKGRFLTALSESEKHGSIQLTYIIHYQIGWTEFYWNHSPEAMQEQYVILKKMLLDEINPDRIEKAYNLRNLCYTANVCGLFAEEHDMTEDNLFWDDLYATLQKDEKHPSSLLYLRIIRLETSILDSLRDHCNVDEQLKELLSCIEESLSRIDIPFEAHKEIISQMGDLINDNPIYEQLIDRIADIHSSRESEISASYIHYERGVQNLNKDNFESAIRHLGKALPGFIKEDTHKELVSTCAMLAFAYKSLDLLYSAKIFLVKAITLSFHEAEINGIYERLSATLLFELCLLDIRLGQFVDFLHWLKVLDVFVAANPAYYDQQFYENRMLLDAVLGTSILKTETSNIEFAQIPDLLRRHSLIASADILLAKLGHNDEVSEDFRSNIMSEQDWMEKIKSKGSGFGIVSPLYIVQKTSSIRTIVNGCTFTVSFHNSLSHLCYSQILLGFMESFVSSMQMKELIVATPNIYIDLRSRKGGKNEVKTTGRTNQYVVKINLETINESTFWNLCVQLLANFITRNARIQDPINLLDAKQKEEMLMSRLNLMMQHLEDYTLSSFDDYKASISEYIRKEDKVYQSKNTVETQEEHFANKQDNRIITDIIDIPLWDKAKWKGCGYMIDRLFQDPPIMMLMFQNIDAGKKILEQWEEQFRKQQLFVNLTIITGVENDNPCAYKVLISPDLNRLYTSWQQAEKRYVVAASRFHKMDSHDDTNIRLFKQAVERFKFAGLTACLIDKDNRMVTTDGNCYPRVIPIRSISFVEAWSIEENSPESVAILASDTPIIPEGHEADAPVLKILKRKQAYESNNR